MGRKERKNEFTNKRRMEEKRVREKKKVVRHREQVVFDKQPGRGSAADKVPR